MQILECIKNILRLHYNTLISNLKSYLAVRANAANLDADAVRLG